MPDARSVSLSTAILLAVALAVTGTPMSAQSAGRIDGTVRAVAGATPVPYAVVSLPALGRERFSDAAGRYSLLGIPDGVHDVLVRRLGFSPWRGTIRIENKASVTLDVQLEVLPFRLPTVAVRELAECPNPGMPDAAREADVFDLFLLLRENADRYRLLASTYAFVYVQSRALGEVSDSGLVIQRVDTSLIESTTRTRYRPGRIVTNTARAGRPTEYTMTIPTILELADDAFVRNHCFGFGGAVQERGETWFRINMRAADRLRSPDVHGAFYLDSATSQLRRMELDLSRPDRLPSALRQVSNVTVVTSFVDIAAGIAVIESVCAANAQRDRSGGRRLPPVPVELQQLIGYRFKSAPPGVAGARSLPTPGWRVGNVYPRRAASCDQ